MLGMDSTVDILNATVLEVVKVSCMGYAYFTTIRES